MAATLQPSIAERDSIRLQGSSADADSSRILAEITRNALHATGAMGAALVLSDGKIMSCRASSGELAPPVGTRLNPDTGFTATCVQTADVVRCDNAATDPRINIKGCLELGIRSILAVPVFDGPKVAGVLEVLSTEPKKFVERHATALKLLARLVETVLNYASHSQRSPEPQAANLIPQATDSKAAGDGPKVMCLSCGHRNPQGSQFCNHCGVILLVSLGQSETALDVAASGTADTSADEGLNEIYKLISENAGRATWNDIYTKLVANLQTISAQQKPQAAAKAEPPKREDALVELGRSRGATELKSRLGTAVRRSLWL